MDGEAWRVVGELSRAGGLVGTKPWPGCLGAGSEVCTEAAEVVKMQVLTFSRSRSAPQCTSHLLPGCINS